MYTKLLAWSGVAVALIAARHPTLADDSLVPLTLDCYVGAYAFAAGDCDDEDSDEGWNYAYASAHAVYEGYPGEDDIWSSASAEISTTNDSEAWTSRLYADVSTENMADASTAVLHGTLVIGATSEFPPGAPLRLRIDADGYGQGFEFWWELRLLRNGEELAVIDSATEVRVAVGAGDVLDVEFCQYSGWYDDMCRVDTVFTAVCAADITGNGVTDQADLGILLALWGYCDGHPNYDPDADLNEDGCINHPDLGILLADWECGT